MPISLAPSSDGKSAVVQVNGQDVLVVSNTGDITTVGGTPIQRMTLTPIKSPSGSAFVDFTGIPSWAKRITLQIQDLSTNRESQVLVQVGTSAGVQTTGYAGSNVYYLGSNQGAAETLSSGFRIFIGGANIYRFGAMKLTRQTANKWIADGQVSHAGGFAWVSGIKVLNDTLDRIRVTTVNGTDLFTQGDISLLIEG